jgi:hypothetical protein
LGANKMFELLALVAVAAFLASVVFLARRARTLFELEFTGERLSRARGRMPQRLLDDLLVVLPRNQNDRLIIRCVLERDQARLTWRGKISPGTLQQLRNLIGMWPLAKLKAAPRLRSH